jgi:beta-xylosidase/AraC-like DNA-binding protein
MCVILKISFKLEGSMEGYTRKEKLKIHVLDNQEEREHFHQDIELLYVLEGALDVSVENWTIHMGIEDILVINANKKHSLSATEDVLYVKLSMLFQLFSDIFHSMNIIIWCDSTKGNNDSYEELRRTIKRLLNHYVSTKGVDNFGHIALCYQIMDLLSVHFMVQAADREQRGTFDERIQEIDNYIRANYFEQISLGELSEKLYLSEGYLSRFFKKYYGMKFSEYLGEIRLYHAVEELLYTNLPITRVAYDNGFSSVASFNRTFKEKYGETPSVFRKKSEEKQQIETIQIAGNNVEERLEIFLRDDGIKEEALAKAKNMAASYSVINPSETKNSWNGIINIGSAADLMKSEVQEHLLILREGLEFRYVRFWDIFSKELLIDPANTGNGFNFSRLDSVLDFLLTHGLKPHIELGMKPKRIMKNVQEALLMEENQADGLDVEAWEKAAHALVRHLFHRYGREVDNWRIELWYNENKWGDPEAEKEYYHMFDKLYGIVREYGDKTEVGGCGLRLHYNEQKLTGFLKEWAKMEHQPDFLSFSYYAYEQGEFDQDQYNKKSTDNDRFERMAVSSRDMMQSAGFADKKLYITEWSLSISDRNYINDTCFKGAYILRNVIHLYGMVDEMAYFHGTDRVTAYYDSNELLYGGNGLVTKDGILKPAGFAFEFLKDLYAYYVGKGDNYLITTDRHDAYKIICHNQKKLNYNYYFSREYELEKEHIWKYYEDRDPLDLQLELTDVKNGIYRIKISRINENSGSVLDIWSDMDYERELSRNDIKYFRRVCEPKLTILKAEVKNHTLDLHIPMEPNEIALVRIKRLL